MSKLKPKHQRLGLVVIALVMLVAASLLGIWAASNTASLFLVPSQIAADPPAPGRAVRLGGMVEQGSIQTREDGVTIDFVVGDGDARVPVQYTGIVPDLFVEGSGVVAEGRLGPDGVFVADNLLAKHDENYVPRELEGMSEHQAKRMAEQTTVGLE